MTLQLSEATLKKMNEFVVSDEAMKQLYETFSADFAESKLQLVAGSGWIAPQLAKAATREYTFTAHDVAQTIRRAADIISRRGWTQGKMKDLQGRMCTLGGIEAALTAVRPITKQRMLYNHVALQLQAWLAENFPAAILDADLSRGVASWNDNCISSGEELQAWLHKFADAIDPPRV